MFGVTTIRQPEKGRATSPQVVGCVVLSSNLVGERDRAGFKVWDLRVVFEHEAVHILKIQGLGFRV